MTKDLGLKLTDVAKVLQDGCDVQLVNDSIREANAAADELPQGRLAAEAKQLLWGLAGNLVVMKIGIAGAEPSVTMRPDVEAANRKYGGQLRKLALQCGVNCTAVHTSVDSRMRELLNEDHRRVEWPQDQWAKKLGCSRSMIAKTPTWKAIMAERQQRKRSRT